MFQKGCPYPIQRCRGEKGLSKNAKRTGHRNMEWHSIPPELDNANHKQPQVSKHRFLVIETLMIESKSELLRSWSPDSRARVVEPQWVRMAGLHLSLAALDTTEQPRFAYSQSKSYHSQFRNRRSWRSAIASPINPFVFL